MKNMQEKNYGKIKKTKKTKVQTHGQGLGRGLAGDMGLNLLFFLFFHGFFAVWPKPREKKKSSDPWARSGERPGWGHGSELVDFCFLFFFHGFLQFGQNLEKTKKKKTSSDPWARSGERPGWGHGSLLFFLGFSMVFCSLAKTSRKTKKTKSSDPWARSGERPGWGHGSDFFP